MKLIYLFFISFLLIGCNTASNTTKNKSSDMQNINCPDSGDCSFEVLKNSKLLIKTDDFGKIYPEVVQGDKLVVKYEFKKRNKKENVDGNYSEFVYFEMDNHEKQVVLKDQELQNVKMLFGRICFCRGAMGYFKVTQGELYLSNHNRNLRLKLTFKMNKVPQIITYIAENIKY
ncbi:MAG: hypothetical protein L3J34_06035 [Flavobacteriaceae bacterium]|nr:hypothetical protein [Flavobacteriaceae bacterium]